MGNSPDTVEFKDILAVDKFSFYDGTAEETIAVPRYGSGRSFRRSQSESGSP